MESVRAPFCLFKWQTRVIAYAKPLCNILFAKMFPFIAKKVVFKNIPFL